MPSELCPLKLRFRVTWSSSGYCSLASSSSPSTFILVANLHPQVGGVWEGSDYGNTEEMVDDMQDYIGTLTGYTWSRISTDTFEIIPPSGVRGIYISHYGSGVLIEKV